MRRRKGTKGKLRRQKKNRRHMRRRCIKECNGKEEILDCSPTARFRKKGGRKNEELNPNVQTPSSCPVFKCSEVWTFGFSQRETSVALPWLFTATRFLVIIANRTLKHKQFLLPHW